MGIDFDSLSPRAQRQVLRQLLKDGCGGAESIPASKVGKQPTEEKIAQSGSKYGNKKVVVNGIEFDSKKEARRYLELDAMAKAGEIQNLRLQVKYLLIPAQRIDGKVVEREVSYVADFVYDQNGETVVEDTKGMKTKDYILKRKMMLFFHGVRIREV